MEAWILQEPRIVIIIKLPKSLGMKEKEGIRNLQLRPCSVDLVLRPQSQHLLAEPDSLFLVVCVGAETRYVARLVKGRSIARCNG